MTFGWCRGLVVVVVFMQHSLPRGVVEYRAETPVAVGEVGVLFNSSSPPRPPSAPDELLLFRILPDPGLPLPFLGLALPLVPLLECRDFLFHRVIGENTLVVFWGLAAS